MSFTSFSAQSSIAKVATSKRGPVAINSISRKQGTWAPGASVPAYLDGSLPGDFGYDPIGLGSDPEALKWNQAAEVLHARTAMAATAGILFTSTLNHVGAGDFPAWWEAGKIAAQNGAVPVGSLIALQAVMAGFAETRRYMDIKTPGSMGESDSFSPAGFGGIFGSTGDANYPGGIFDPLKFSSRSDIEELKVKEIVNGRLAMMSFIGYVCQYNATGKDPIDALLDHISNPNLNNFANNGVSFPDCTVWLPTA